MFTGLIEAVGTVREARESPYGVRLVVDPPGATEWQHQITTGESIAIAGVCLTARHPDRVMPHATPLPPGEPLAFDVVPETLERTTLGTLKAGARVNLERAVRADTLMGGHFVQGHVDGTARVSDIQPVPDNWRLRVSLPPELLESMVPKGSVAIDGVSLTIARVETDRPDDPGSEGQIEIALIPTTLERTTLAQLRIGDPVNIEADMLTKSIIATVKRMGLTPSRPPHTPHTPHTH